MIPLLSLLIPPPPLPPCSTPLEFAERAAMFGYATVDQTWLLREAVEVERNRLRAADWAIRLKVLGPRP